MTVRHIVILAAALPVLCAAAFAQPLPPPGTVNSYTAADLAKARAAASAAGFTPGVVASAQAGNLFLKATKEGRTYFLTVTPDGQVYPGIGS